MIASHSQRHARLSLSLAVRHESMVDLRHQVLGSLSWTPLALFCILCCALTSAKSHGGKIMHFLPHRWTWTKTLIGRITGAFCTDTFTSNRNCHPPTKHELAYSSRMSSASKEAPLLSLIVLSRHTSRFICGYASLILIKEQPPPPLILFLLHLPSSYATRLAAHAHMIANVNV